MSDHTTGDGDDELTSEALLRRAREEAAGLGVPPSDAVPPQPSTPTSPDSAVTPPVTPPPVTPPPGAVAPPTVGAASGAPGTPQPPANMGFPQQPASAPPPASSGGSSIPWRRILPIALIGVVFLGGVIYSCGRTNADDLEIGDCFELPDDEFTSVNNQDCSGPHEAQIFAEVSSILGGEEACFNALAEVPGLADPSVTIPESAYISGITAEDDNLNVQCVIADDAGGLVGSVLGD